jgi:exopolysaccharide biosynthesis predicted pyruvyltransferase EpsI
MWPFPATRRGASAVVAVGSPRPARHRLLGPERFADVCLPLVGKRVGYVRPEGNVGDELIELAMVQLFAAYGIRWSPVSCRASSPTLEHFDLLVFGGGGNMGTRYAGNHELRGRALATGLPLVILPQSFTSPEDRPFHRVFVRERASLGLRPDGILAPDLALGLEWPAAPPPRHDLGVYLRRDQERGGRKPLLARDPVRLARTPADYLALAARHRRIITDRLHFAVAGLHAGRQVTLVANDYHKNRSMHETWLAYLGCHFAASAADAFAWRRRAA